MVSQSIASIYKSLCLYNHCTIFMYTVLEVYILAVRHMRAIQEIPMYIRITNPFSGYLKLLSHLHQVHHQFQSSLQVQQY